MTEATLILPLPLEHQLEAYGSPARFKVLRWGRRRGKTRFAFIAANVGHGPGWEEDHPMWEGLLQGWDVVWLGKDYPQARQIWEEAVEPRYRGVPGITLNETERTVKLQDGGTLHIRSAEMKSLQGIRGLGARVKGVIVDEGAHLDLEYAWKSVLRPILVDNKGWAILMSTTNAGFDGGKDPETGNQIAPSYFNRLCEDIMGGKVGRRIEDGWAHFYGIAADNPKIDKDEWEAFLGEYTAGSLALEQEVYAKLLAKGAGLAFPEWRDDLHLARVEPPVDAEWFGGLDWGYTAPAAFVALAAWGDRFLSVRREYYETKRTPYQMGYSIGEILKPYPRLTHIACDPSIFAVTDGGETIAEGVQHGLIDSLGRDRAPALVAAPSGPGSRATRKALLHEQLKYEERKDDEGQTIVPAWLRPKLTVHPDCANLVRTLPKLPRHAKKPEDVDTTAEDHAYDALTYPLLARAPQGPAQERPLKDVPPRDIHPGYVVKNGVPVEKEPYGAPDFAQAPHRTGVRWRRQRPDEESE